MISLLVNAVAFAQSTPDPLFEQLLGTPTVGDSPSIAVANTIGALPTNDLFLTTPQLIGSGIIIALLGLLSLWLKNRRPRLDAKPSAMRIISQLSMPGGSSIAVVQVTTNGGPPRQLLIGLGSGSPTLITDLTSHDVTPKETVRAPAFETVLTATESHPHISENSEDTERTNSANALLETLMAARKTHTTGHSRWA